MPGASRNAFGAGDVDEYLSSLGPCTRPAGPLPQQFADFEAIYQSSRPDRPLGGLPSGPGPAGLPGLAPFLHVSSLPDLMDTTCSSMSTVANSSIIIFKICSSSLCNLNDRAIGHIID